MNYDLFMFLVLAAIAAAAFKTSELGEESVWRRLNRPHVVNMSSSARGMKFAPHDAKTQEGSVIC